MSEPAAILSSGLKPSYADIRAHSERLAAKLTPEDQAIQSMPDASPTKWHLAHTTWFFETLILLPGRKNYRPFDPDYTYLFNSYYEGLGPRHPRPQRGMLTRPSSQEILAYRRHVDAAMEAMFDDVAPNTRDVFEQHVVLGLHHEQQHQELLLTDIKHAFSLNPLLPEYAPLRPTAPGLMPKLDWHAFEGGVTEVGHSGSSFAFDNECPRHKVYLHPFKLASRLVTCGEYAEFVADGGYTRPEFWLSDGWACVNRENWSAPLYWRDDERGRHEFTLHGKRPLNMNEPVTHISFYEAAAYAAWAGKRLPTEFEWERAALTTTVRETSFDEGHIHPRIARGNGLNQMFGEVWQWTRSSYDPYPGYRPFEGAASEYNGKFMIGQIVLRGSSCATPDGHARATYRNFFPPSARWQFSGIRLADDA